MSKEMERAKTEIKEREEKKALTGGAAREGELAEPRMNIKGADQQCLVFASKRLEDASPTILLTNNTSSSLANSSRTCRRLRENTTPHLH